MRSGKARERRILVYGMSDNPGGIETYLMGLFRRMPRGTFDFICDFPDIVCRDELTAGGAAVHFFPAKSRSLRGHWRAVASVLRAHPEYDTVYFNVLDAGCVFAAVVPWLMGRRVVVHSHNDDTDKRRLHRLCRPLLACVTGGAAACSPAAAAYMFPRRKAARALILPNVIDAARFRFSPETRERTRCALGIGDRRAVLWVGRMTRQKNPIFLVDVFERLHAADERCVLLAVGTGEQSAEVEAYAAQKGLGSDVMFLGARDDVPDIMQAADVFLFPSLYEGWGIAAVEAQAAGLPCVVSDAVPRSVDMTGLVTFVPLAKTAEQWAQIVRALPDGERTDKTEDIRRAGYDLSCCADHDRRLMSLLTGAEEKA